MDRKDWTRIGLIAAVFLVPGGFVLGGALAARRAGKAISDAGAKPDSNSAGPAADGSTLAFYQSNAATYVEARPAVISPDLIEFLPRLEPGSLILELGCGSGHDAAEMERRGFQVDATDGVPAMAAIANERLQAGARVLRFNDLDATDHYDAVVACASLLHVPSEDLPAVLGRVWNALKPGGWHFASFKTDGQPGWDKHGRYYNYLNRAGAIEAYEAAGEWASLSFQNYDGTGYFSEPARWLTITAQKQP